MQLSPDYARIDRVVRSANPWWDHKAPRVAARTRAAYGRCFSWLTDPNKTPALLLSGPRGAGKTAIVRQLIAALLAAGAPAHSLVYLPLDHPVLAASPLEPLVLRYRRGGAASPVVFFVDEVAYAKGGERDLYRVADRRQPWRVFATTSTRAGEASRAGGAGESHVARVRLQPPSFYESLVLEGAPLPDIPDGLTHTHLFRLPSADRARLVKALRRMSLRFDRYALGGGRLGSDLQLTEDVAHAELRDGVLGAVLARDLPLLFGAQPRALEALLVHVCGAEGDVFSMSGAADALGMTRQTVAAHLGLLERAHVVRLLRPLGERATGKPRVKVVLVNGAVAAALRGSPYDLLWGEEGGRTRLASVRSALLAAFLAEADAADPLAGYLRDPKAGRTVDFVLRGPDGVVPVLASVGIYGERYRDVDEEDSEAAEARERSDALVLRTLEAACRKGERVTHAYWPVVDGERIESLRVRGTNAHILRVPAHVLAYLLGRSEWSRSAVAAKEVREPGTQESVEG